MFLVKNSYFLKHPLSHIYNNQQYIDELVQRLNRSLKTKKELKEKHLLHIGERLNALNPLSIFSRGYSIVKDDNNKIIKSVNEIEKNQVLNICLIDGKINCKVIEYVKEGKTFAKF